MYNWITSWWSSETNINTGPARNLPVSVNIKQLVDNRPASVLVISSDEILNRRNSLKKTVINSQPASIKKKPIMQEFDKVFEKGIKTYLKPTTDNDKILTIAKKRLSNKLSADKLDQALKELEKVLIDIDNTIEFNLQQSLQHELNKGSIIPEDVQNFIDKICKHVPFDTPELICKDNEISITWNDDLFVFFNTDKSVEIGFIKTRNADSFYSYFETPNQEAFNYFVKLH